MSGQTTIAQPDGLDVALRWTHTVEDDQPLTVWAVWTTGDVPGWLDLCGFMDGHVGEVEVRAAAAAAMDRREAAQARVLRERTVLLPVSLHLARQLVGWFGEVPYDALAELRALVVQADPQLAERVLLEAWEHPWTVIRT